MSAATPSSKNPDRTASRSRRRTRGAVDVLPSGCWRARFTTPEGRRLTATLETKREADAWLAAHTADIARGGWVDPNRGRSPWAPTPPNRWPSAMT